MALIKVLFEFFNLRDLDDGMAVLGYRVAQHVAGKLREGYPLPLPV